MKDLIGRSIEPGDVVAITTRSYGHNYIRVGTVAEVRPYTLETYPYDPVTRKSVPKQETRYEAIVDVFIGSGYTFRKSTWDGKKHVYHPHKGYRRTYQVEENIVIVRKAHEDGDDLRALSEKLKSDRAAADNARSEAVAAAKGSSI